MEYNLIPPLYNNLKTIRFVGKKLEKQSAYARGDNAIETSEDERIIWNFVAPNEISENVNHSWEPYDSIASRLANKLGELNKNVGELKGLSGAGSGALKELTSGNAGGAGQAAVSGIKEAEIPSYRIDSSLMYKDTNRREYSFTFTLIDYWGDPYNSVVKPVRELEKYSCPELSGELIDINFPYIFKIYTVESDLLKINNAALTSVSPTWSGPYVNNYPIKCELSITIKDIEPLYRRSFEEGGIIRTE